MARANQIRWREPYQATLKRRREFLAGAEAKAFQRQLWRATAAAAVLGVGIALWIASLTPGMIIPWWRMGLGVVMCPVYLLVALRLTTLSPAWITVRPDRIEWSTGGGGARAEWTNMCEIGLHEEDDATWIDFEFISRNGKSVRRSFAVATRVDRSQLTHTIDDLKSRMTLNQPSQGERHASTQSGGCMAP
jgi:hypothetical protein